MMLTKSKKTKRRGIEEAQAVTAECFKRGLILITAGMNTLRVIPPLNVSREELDDGLDVIEKALGQVNSGA